MSSEIVLSCYVQSFFNTNIFFFQIHTIHKCGLCVLFWDREGCFRVGSRGLWAKIFDMAFDSNAV